MKRFDLRSFTIGAFLGVVILSVFLTGAVADRALNFGFLDRLLPRKIESLRVGTTIDQKVVNEESVVIEVAEKVSPSVVTVSVKTPQREVIQFSPFLVLGEVWRVVKNRI